MTIAEALTGSAARLRAAGIETPWREARLLVAMAANVAAETIIGYPERSLDPASQATLEELLCRRCGREPLSRIAGVREFWSLRFAISRDTLDPRPDSETLVDAVLAQIGDRTAGLRILDLGVGTGCLLLSLLSELPNATGIGLDISEGACRTARANAATLGLIGRASIVAANWTDCLADGGVDLVVSNPPYIPDGEISDLAPEVGFDPWRALAGGSDGLDAYRHLAPALLRLLTEDGLVALEVGRGQSDAVERLLAAAGFADLEVHRDLSGVSRCIIARNRPESWIAHEKGVSNGSLSH